MTTPGERLALARAAKAAKKAAAEAQIDQVEMAVDKTLKAADRQDVLLTEEDIAAIREEAEKLFFDERRKKARQMAIKNELATLRREHGDSAIFGNHMDDIITIPVELPDFAEAIIIDQRRIEHGKPFTGPRHVVASILETMWNGQKHDHNLSGKNRDEFYRKQRPVEVTNKGASVIQTEGVRIG